MDLAEEFASGGIDCEELVGAGRSGDEGFVVGAEFDGEGGGKGLPGLGMNRRERLEVDEVRFFSSVLLEFNAGNLIQEGAVFEFGEAVFFSAGATIDVITSVGLSNKNGAF